MDFRGKRGEGMSEFVKVIGAFVLTTILITIPILTGISFILKWNDLIQWILTVLTIMEWGTIFLLIKKDTEWS